MNNCLIKIVQSCSLCGVLSLKCDSCLIRTVQRCSPCGVRVVIEKGVLQCYIPRTESSNIVDDSVLEYGF